MTLIKFTFLSILFFMHRQDSGIQSHVIHYIEEYKFIAIDEMERSGMPASVILAQAIIESNAGTSKLARASNNHFGIKCKDYWKGKEYYSVDDDRDAKGNLIPSCFRAYESVQASYLDHSDFLMGTEHYQPLFKYDRIDYELWAHGLQLCGYATDDRYAEKLIRTIELYRLHELDYYTVQYVDPGSLNEDHELKAPIGN